MPQVEVGDGERRSAVEQPEQIANHETGSGRADGGSTDSHPGDVNEAAARSVLVHTRSHPCGDLRLVGVRLHQGPTRGLREGHGRILGSGEGVDHDIEVVDRPTAEATIDYPGETIIAKQEPRITAVEPGQGDGRLGSVRISVRRRLEVVVEGTLDDRGIDAEAFERTGNDPGLALADIGVGDKQLRRSVPGDDTVVVDETDTHLAGGRIRQHPATPGVRLPQVPDPEQPRQRGRGALGRPLTSFCTGSSTPMRIWGSSGRGALLRMRRRDWRAMLTELGRRGHGTIESGAFLLAKESGDPTRVTRIVYYDDLDPDCLVGGIHFHGLAYDKLWSLCRTDGLRVIGDVHTHPSGWVEQSNIDRGSPMVAQQGHVGVIVPHFA